MLFADVEGSTALQESSGRDYALAIAAVRRLVREQVLARSGVEVDAIGGLDVRCLRRCNGRREGRRRRNACSGRMSGLRARRTRAYRPPRSTRSWATRATRASTSCAPRGSPMPATASRSSSRRRRGRRWWTIETYDLGTYRLTGLSVPEELHQVRADGLPETSHRCETPSPLGNAIRVVIAGPSCCAKASCGCSRSRVRGPYPDPETPTTCCAMSRCTNPTWPIGWFCPVPPTHTDEGLRAAQDIRARFPRRASSCCRSTSRPTTRWAPGRLVGGRRLPAQRPRVRPRGVRRVRSPRRRGRLGARPRRREPAGRAAPSGRIRWKR